MLYLHDFYNIIFKIKQISLNSLRVSTPPTKNSGCAPDYYYYYYYYWFRNVKRVKQEEEDSRINMKYIFVICNIVITCNIVILTDGRRP